jgi:hypothetical protein
MMETRSPLSRSIGFSGAVRFLTAVSAAIALGSAISSGRYLIAGVVLVFLIGTAKVGPTLRRTFVHGRGTAESTLRESVWINFGGRRDWCRKWLRTRLGNPRVHQCWACAGEGS